MEQHITIVLEFTLSGQRLKIQIPREQAELASAFQSEVFSPSLYLTNAR